ncbi:DUF6538 domain-containing protein [Ancylobacter sp. SL191]|uniref:DUF6538 domain-containing protein n=1 Tax=Ancylobacter sp. SL191 TaxID=2995166 RepID=UPI003B63B27E
MARIAAKVRHLLNRKGRFFARLVVPKDLRPFMDGKSELRSSLGPDRRTALKKLAGATRPRAPRSFMIGGRMR